MEANKVSKIWKSLLSMKLACPAYKPSKSDANRMAVSRAMHEQVRFGYKEKMVDDGWQVLDTEIPIENSFFKGKIDDVYRKGDLLLVAEYVSSIIPGINKFYDAAISIAYLRLEYGANAKGVVVSRGEITDVPDFLIERTMQMVDRYRNIMNLVDEELLEFANPASGFCNYRDNKLCKWNSNTREKLEQDS